VVLGGVFTLGETDYVKATDMSENVAGDFGRFATGTEVWWRSIVDERVGYTIPTTVLVDNEVRVALLQRHGCICKRRRGLRGGLRGRVLSAQDWDGGHVDRLWKGPDSIRLWPVGASFSVIRNWNSQQRCLSGWYGNLEQPWTRRGNGFDTRDLILDVQIEDDLSGWILKDEDELAAAEDVGLISATETDEVQRVAREVGRKIDERQWPFSEEADVWRTLSPVGDWRIAELPTGWDLTPPVSL
jgi:hypothetical protein